MRTRSGVGVSVLLRQPHSFEGLRLVVVVVDPRDLAVPESGDDGVLALDADATPAPSGPHNDERNDLIASVNEAHKLHRQLSKVSPQFVSHFVYPARP